MKYRAKRTCTEIAARGLVEDVSRPLAEYRGIPAYVLLGDPGSGKTTEFELEEAAMGEDALLISARDFLAFSPEHRPQWQGRTLFIDGWMRCEWVSRMRVPGLTQSEGASTPWESPLSDFHVDRPIGWGEIDRSKLEDVSPNGNIKVLNLDSLSESEVARIVGSHPNIGAPEAFAAKARERGVGGLLTNPQIWNC